MSRKPSVTLHINASRNVLIADGQTFDRSVMTKGELAKVRRLIVMALFPAGVACVGNEVN